MKKILALILAMMMLLAFAACDKKSDSDSDEKDSASKLPSAVTDEVEDVFDDDGVEVGSLKCEYKQSKDDASYYVISGKITDVEDEEFEDYKDGYFFGVAYEYDGEAEYMSMGVYEKDNKDDFEDDLKEFIEECKDNKDDIDELLEGIAYGN